MQFRVGDIVYVKNPLTREDVSGCFGWPISSGIRNLQGKPLIIKGTGPYPDTYHVIENGCYWHINAFADSAAVFDETLCDMQALSIEFDKIML